MPLLVPGVALVCPGMTPHACLGTLPGLCAGEGWPNLSLGLSEGVQGWVRGVQTAQGGGVAGTPHLLLLVACTHHWHISHYT